MNGLYLVLSDITCTVVFHVCSRLLYTYIVAVSNHNLGFLSSFGILSSLSSVLTSKILVHVMHKRFHAQRQHIVHSVRTQELQHDSQLKKILQLDTLLYQLHTLSFFLSPSIWIYIVRILSQFQYSKPRELDPSRSLRFFYSMVLLFNLPSLWKHFTRGEAGGRVIILDFIGMCMLNLSDSCAGLIDLMVFKSIYTF